MKFKVITKKKKKNPKMFCIAIFTWYNMSFNIHSMIWIWTEKNPRNNIDNSTIKTQRVASLYI